MQLIGFVGKVSTVLILEVALSPSNAPPLLK